MAAKRTRELRLLPGEDAPRGTGKRSTAAGAGAQTIIPTRRVERSPFSLGPPMGDVEPTPEDWPTDPQSTLYVLIVQQWVQTLTGPFDWANWPLERYVFSDTFLESLEHQADLDNVAWACAMVACGLAHEFHELRLEPLTAEPSNEHVVRGDGAQGYRCSILSGRGAGARLDFWRLPSGVIEFDVFTALRVVRSEKPNTEPGPTVC